MDFKKKWYDKVIDFYRLTLIPVFRVLLVVRIGEINKKGFHAKTYSFNMWHPITWLRILLQFSLNLVTNIIISIITVVFDSFIETYVYFEGNSFFYKRIKD